MRIRTRLIASAALAGLLTLGIGAGLFSVTLRTQAGFDDQANAEEVARGVANMLSLTNEFTVFGGERVASQWRSHHARLVATVDATIARQAVPTPDLTELQRNLGDLPSLFETLVGIEDAPRTALTARRRELLLERLIAETQEVLETRYRWTMTLADARRRDQQYYTAMVLAAPAAMLLLLLSLGLLVARRVLVPLERLQTAAAAMQRGDLDVRCGSDAADELGDAARAVDAMAMSLQRQTAAVLASERRLRLITDNIPALIGHVDAERRYTFVNARFGELGRGPAAAMPGRTMADVHGEALYAQLEPYVDAALAGRQVVFETSREIAGRIVHRESTYVADVDDAGRVQGFFALGFDVTERREAELAVARSERRLQELTDSIPAMVGYFDMQERCQYTNDAGLRSQGTESAQIPGMPLRAMLGESDYAQHEPYVRKVLAGRRARFEGSLALDSGEAHFQAHLIPDRVDGGPQRGFYLMTFDVTALKEAQHEQARVERQLRGITDNLPVLISYIDRHLVYRFMNATCRQWLGVEPSSVIGANVAATVPAAYYAQRREFMQRALAGERLEFETVTPALGIVRHLHSTYVPDIQPDGSVAGIIALTADISAAKKTEQRLSELARVDELTGLPNRRSFEERLAEGVARAVRARKPIALMFLDIDRFKSINDGLGHAVGDAVLREFADRLKRAVRRTDIAARLGGDEFVVLLEGLHAKHEAELVAEKVVDAMRAPFDIAGEPLLVTASLGVAYCALPGPNTALMEKADEALYRAKDAGRNTFRMSSMEAVVTGFGDLRAVK